MANAKKMTAAVRTLRSANGPMSIIDAPCADASAYCMRYWGVCVPERRGSGTYGIVYACCSGSGSAWAVKTPPGWLDVANDAAAWASDETSHLHRASTCPFCTGIVDRGRRRPRSGAAPLIDQRPPPPATTTTGSARRPAVAWHEEHWHAKAAAVHRGCACDISASIVCEVSSYATLGRHRNVARVLGYEASRAPCLRAGGGILRIELADTTLHKLAASTPGGLPEHLVLELAGDIFAALAHLHECGFTHRDVKSGNILLFHGRGGDGGRIRAKLCDLGSAVWRHSSALAYIWPATTCCYSPPEVVQSQHLQSHAPPLDVWSAGIVMCDMLFGAPCALRCDSFSERLAALSALTSAPGGGLARCMLPSHTSSGVAGIVSLALRYEPEDRASSADICAAVSAVLSAASVPLLLLLPGPQPRSFDAPSISHGRRAPAASTSCECGHPAKTDSVGESRPPGESRGYSRTWQTCWRQEAYIAFVSPPLVKLLPNVDWPEIQRTVADGAESRLDASISGAILRLLALEHAVWPRACGVPRQSSFSLALALDNPRQGSQTLSVDPHEILSQAPLAALASTDTPPTSSEPRVVLPSPTDPTLAIDRLLYGFLRPDVRRQARLTISRACTKFQQSSAVGRAAHALLDRMEHLCIRQHRLDHVIFACISLAKKACGDVTPFDPRDLANVVCSDGTESLHTACAVEHDIFKAAGGIVHTPHPHIFIDLATGCDACISVGRVLSPPIESQLDRRSLHGAKVHHEAERDIASAIVDAMEPCDAFVGNRWSDRASAALRTASVLLAASGRDRFSHLAGRPVAERIAKAAFMASASPYSPASGSTGGCFALIAAAAADGTLAARVSALLPSSRSPHTTVIIDTARQVFGGDPVFRADNLHPAQDEKCGMYRRVPLSPDVPSNVSPVDMTTNCHQRVSTAEPSHEPRHRSHNRCSPESPESPYPSSPEVSGSHPPHLSSPKSSKPPLSSSTTFESLLPHLSSPATSGSSSPNLPSGTASFFPSDFRAGATSGPPPPVTGAVAGICRHECASDTTEFGIPMSI